MKRFVPILRIRFPDLMDAYVDTLGAGARLVLQNMSLTFNSFDFTDSAGLFVDATKVKDAGAYISDCVKQLATRFGPDRSAYSCTKR